jgi:tetratricopeptide (TPR) repeat protein
VRAACRAHAIFGRVFGRMGDAENARTSLERSLALARELDRSETILALSELGYHLQLAEAHYEAAEQAFSEALGLAEAIGDVPRQIELHFALATQAVYAGEWERVQQLADGSAELAEREGLAGKLCLPGALRGFLRWRAGEFEQAAGLFRDSHAAAESAGWSEVAWAALLGLAVVLRDRGQLGEAAATLEEAVQVCERTGLAAQGLQCRSAIAVTLALAGDRRGAAGAAARAVEAGRRLHYPICRAAVQEAQGAAETPPEGVQALDAARALWEELGRSLDAARCELLAGEHLRAHDPAAAAERLAAAQARFERLGIAHLAERARALAV